MDLLVFGLVCLLVGVVFGAVLGWIACAHVHAIAKNATAAPVPAATSPPLDNQTSDGTSGKPGPA